MHKKTGLDAFRANLGMMLRDLPRGVTAELTDDVIAYWAGRQLVFCFLRDDASGLIEEEFDFEDYVWEEWEPRLADWMRGPVFACREEVLHWMKDAPPTESGIEE